MNRREFLKTACLAAAGALAVRSAAGVSAESATHVYIVPNPSDAIAGSGPVRWAIGNLIAALKQKNVRADVIDRLSDAPGGTGCIMVASAASDLASGILKRLDLAPPRGPESLSIVSTDLNGRRAHLASGHDVRGLVYALTELADSVALAVTAADVLKTTAPIVEHPANKIRSVMRMIASEVEDKSWFHDRGFWERYLTMLVGHRFNRINFSVGLGYDFPRDIKDAYFYFAYPFLLSVPGYEVRVPQLPAAERDKNLEMLRFASDEAAKRGLEFQLGIWTHAYEWPNSPDVNYTVEGISRDNHATYCRDAVRILLKECPNITGVTFRIHGESGVAEGSYEFWKQVFHGVATCGRRVGIDMHAKGMDQPMVDLALASGLPITISPKYWAEHMGLPYHQAWIRPTEMPRPPRVGQGAQGGQGFFSRSSGSRSFLRYGYGDLMAEDRKYDILFRMWPGTQRLLLWGDPVFAAAYGRASSFCGAAGLELMEPLSFKGRKGSGISGPRDAYVGEGEKGNHDFDDYTYSYRLWGRLSYNPDAQPDVWQRQLCAECGGASDEVEKTLASASRILPLITTAHLPSAANNNYWPEIYTNMSIVDSRRPGSYSDTPSPKRFGTVSPLDPQLFSRVDDHAEELLKGELSGKYSPAEVAQWLLGLADAATADSLRARQGTKFRKLQRARTDIAIQAGIGRFFAHKLRAGVLYAIFDKTLDASALTAAIDCYRKARDAWNAIADGPASQYANDITFGLEKQLRGTWKDRLPAIDQDIALMQRKTDSAKTSDGVANVAAAIGAVLEPPARPKIPATHTPPAAFVAGQDLRIELAVADKTPAVSGKLYFRHVDQSIPWEIKALIPTDRLLGAIIPAMYTDSPFPLQYYFELKAENDRAVSLYPGLGPTLSGQPYFVARRSR
jgi:hypothetical protein